MAYRTFLPPLVALFCCLPACSAEKEGPKAPPSPYDTAAGFCEKWAEAACNDDVVSACSGGGADVEACQDSQQAFCAQLVTESRYTDSKADAEACVDAVKAAYADGVLSAEEAETVLRLRNDCETISSGSGAEGASCQSDADCSTRDGLACVVPLGEATGTCYVPVEQGGGFECTGADQVCAEGFYCNGEICQRRKVDGEVCSDTLPCLESLQCFGSVCRPKAPVSSACSSDEECASGLCAKGSSETGLCSAQIILSATEPTCQNLR